MKDAEENYDYSDFAPSTVLNIVPKQPEFEKLAKLISNFLYSTSHEANYDG